MARLRRSGTRPSGHFTARRTAKQHPLWGLTWQERETLALQARLESASVVALNIIVQ